MPHATCGATAGVVSQKLYIAGGRGNDSTGSTCLQVYDTVLETWELGPKVPEYLRMTSGAVVEDKLYIVGKSDATESYVCVYFIPESNEWKYTDAIGPSGEYESWESSFRAVNHNGSLWVLFNNRAGGVITTYWYQLGDKRNWSKIPSAVAPGIPDHIVGDIGEIEGVVSTVVKLYSAGACFKRGRSNLSFLRTLVRFPNSIRLPSLHVMITIFMY
jgi:hypothetical protein